MAWKSIEDYEGRWIDAMRDSVICGSVSFAQEIGDGTPERRIVIRLKRVRWSFGSRWTTVQRIS